MNERFGVRQLCCRFYFESARLYIWRNAMKCASTRGMRTLFCVNRTIKNISHFLN